MSDLINTAKTIINALEDRIPEETIFDIEYCKNIYAAVKTLGK